MNVRISVRPLLSAMIMVATFLVATVRKGIAYNAPLEEISDKDETERVDIAKGADEAEMEHIENGLAVDILNKIYND